MKAAVITPYHGESSAVLQRCHKSVLDQTVDVRHILVSDGMANAEIDAWNVDHHLLPCAHDDAGATPRAMAALSAFSQGYEVVFFLDADNWYEPQHVQIMIDVLKESGADAAIGTRTIRSRDGTLMYVDTIESNGENMIDTNTWALTARSLPYLHTWIVPPAQRLWSDRSFDHAMRNSGLTIARCHVPTVAYVTRWAWHYQHAGLQIPDDAVWIDQSADGTLIHRRHDGK
jgi:glycosyltransferase involved in cell wall biosynthesis